MIIPPGKMCAQPATGCNYRPCPSLGVQGGSDAVQQVYDRLLMIYKEKHPNPGNKIRINTFDSKIHQKIKSSMTLALQCGKTN